MDQHPVKIVRHAIYLLVQPFTIRGIRTVEQMISLLFRKILPLFIKWKQTGLGVLLPVPVAHMECRKVCHPFVPGLFRVYTAFNIHGHHFTNAGAFGTHTIWIIKGKIGRSSCIRLADAGIKKSQCSIHITDGTHSRTGIASQTGLIHNDRGGKIVDSLHLWLFIFWQSSTHKSSISFVHLSLALGSDRVKYNTGFPGT